MSTEILFTVNKSIAQLIFEPELSDPNHQPAWAVCSIREKDVHRERSLTHRN